MSDNRWTVIAASIAGVLLIVIAIVYFAEPAKSLPGFFPGHEAGSSHHHVKHGIAALLLGMARSCSPGSRAVLDGSRPEAWSRCRLR